MMERNDRNDITENALAAEPIDPTDANDPIEAIENALPIDPMDMTESFDAIDRNEFSDLQESLEFLPEVIRRT